MIGYLILAFGCLTFGTIIGLLVAGLCAEAANVVPISLARRNREVMP